MFYNQLHIIRTIIQFRRVEMETQLIKAMLRNQLVDMMYVSKSGEISKRRIKVTKVLDNSFTAYCFTKQAKRTFLIDNVLALQPVIRKKREVI